MQQLWRCLALPLILLVFVLVGATDENNDRDDHTITITQSNNTDGASDVNEYMTLEDDYYDDIDADSYDQTHNQSYQDIADKLNCSTLVILHKGIKSDEIKSDSIYIKKPSKKAETNMNCSKIVFEETDSEEKHDNEYEDDKSIQLSDYEQGPKSKTERLGTADNATNVNSFSEVDRNQTVGNDTDAEMDVDSTECTEPSDDQTDYNWYQILVNNGGAPGEVNATRLSPKAKEIHEFCRRPINETGSSSEDLLYEFELIEIDKVYRLERAFLRFAGTPAEFVDVIGRILWASPDDSSAFYRLTYRKDDTGFYLHMRPQQNCLFEKDVKSGEYNVLCASVHIDYQSLSVGLQAALIGRK